MVMGETRYLQRARDLHHLLNGDWISHILVALSTGPLHYKDLYATVKELSTFDPWAGSEHPIPRRTLGRTLRRLVTAGLIVRHEERVFPRSVIYSLTPAAEELLVRAGPLIGWAEEHQDLFERLQRAQAEKKGRRSRSESSTDDELLD